MTALIYTIIVAVLVAADQLTKRVVVNHMQLNQTIPAIDGLLDWTYILNDGASFGMLGGKTTLLLIVTGIVMAVLAVALYTGKFDKHLTGRISALLILAGGIGNCIDRVFNGGKVVDFIDISPIFEFPKFNLADCFVCCGGVLFCVYVLFFYDDKKEKLLAAGAAEGEGTVTDAPEAVAEAVAEEPEAPVPHQTEGDDGTA